MGEKGRVAEFRFDRTNYFATHIALSDELAGWNMNLITVAGSMGNRRAIDNAVEAGPEDRSHTHRTRFTSCVERVTSKKMILDSFASESDGVHFGVASRIVFLRGLINCSDQGLAGPGTYNHGPERHGCICRQGSLSESDETNHLLSIKARASGAFDFCDRHGCAVQIAVFVPDSG